MRKTSSGFTIVELLIVIVVIAILASIAIVAYSGIQNRARNSKIESDLNLIKKSVMAARINNDSPLYAIVQLPAPEANCIAKNSGTNLANLNKDTDPCWTQYLTYLARVSDKSGIDIKNIVDPWGRPYYVNPNEDEGPISHVCLNDTIGTYNEPFDKGATFRNISLFKTSC